MHGDAFKHCLIFCVKFADYGKVSRFTFIHSSILDTFWAPTKYQALYASVNETKIPDLIELHIPRGWGGDRQSTKVINHGTVWAVTLA